MATLNSMQLLLRRHGRRHRAHNSLCLNAKLLWIAHVAICSELAARRKISCVWHTCRRKITGEWRHGKQTRFRTPSVEAFGARERSLPLGIYTGMLNWKCHHVTDMCVHPEKHRLLCNVYMHQRNVSIIILCDRIRLFFRKIWWWALIHTVCNNYTVLSHP